MKILKKIVFLACFNSLSAFMVTAHAAQAFDFASNWAGTYYLHSGICRNGAGHGVYPGTATLTVTYWKYDERNPNRIIYNGYLKLSEPRGVPAGFEYYSSGTGAFESSMSDNYTTLWPLEHSLPHWSGHGSVNRISVATKIGNCEVTVTVTPLSSKKK